MARTQQRTARASQVRPRYARISAAGSALGVTLVAVLGGVGLLPTDPATRMAADEKPAARVQAAPRRAVAPSVSSGLPPTPRPARVRRADTVQTDTSRTAPLPAHSGTGKRVVFDMSAQRVWLVDPSVTRKVLRTYLVSGSVTDNLKPGSYQVYSRSLHAIGIDDSGTMEYMVRFTTGDHSAIGFHDIPVKDGHLVQSRDQLGTPRSHGCIRQWRPDARALWRFAPVGTRVVVIA